MVRVVHDHRPYAQPDASPPPGIDAAALEADLRAAVRGEVRFDDGARAMYSTDASNYRQVPIGVVVPRDKQDVIAAVRVCHRHGAPIVPRGGGTSLAGQACNVAVVLDMSQHLRGVLRIDPARRIAVVEPGCVLDDLRDAAREHGLTFGPDPSTHNRCTLGGMVGNNSCGVHSQMAGRTADNVVELEVLTYEGDVMRVGATGEEALDAIIAAGGPQGRRYAQMRALRDKYADLIRARYPDIPRRVSGFNLDELLPEKGFHVARALAGTEGTCVLVLEITVQLVPNPEKRAMLVLGYPSIEAAADHVVEVGASGCIGLEAIDSALHHLIREERMYLDYLKVLPPGEGWLLAEFGGSTQEDADAQAETFMARLRQGQDPPSMKLIDDEVQEHHLWLLREAALGATARPPGQADTWEGWEDSAVPPRLLGTYLRALKALYAGYGYHGALYGHFGQGCVHTRIDFGLKDAEGLVRFRSFLDDAARLVTSLGGSLSGEHGDGQSKAALLPIMFGEELVKAFAQFKRIWDAQGKMNPGKVVAPYAPTQNLRLGTAYAPRDPATHFTWTDDDDSFARAAQRCVGVGLCRREAPQDGGVMCPSYMVTREEQHSTRGRARLLFEMLQGDVLTEGWRSEAVREALDLCLSCKGCKSDCPVNVDMASYKAEFLAHYYHRRLRPRSAYALGLIPWAARVASKVPRLANAVTQNRVLSRPVKWLAGVHPDRTLPPFARATLRSQLEARGSRVDRPRGRVLLWPDTFNNFFHPEVGLAAAEVLEAAGYEVALPPAGLCCGRPLYDYGFLPLARKLLERDVAAMRDDLRAGTLLVGLEPSCTAVFRDELPMMLPHDEDARRLRRQTFVLSEFLMDHVPGWSPPPLPGKALVQRHCHHHAVMGFGAEERLLRGMGLDVELPDSGCCGMAGSFGFEKTHYDVAQAVGERSILPKVRQADRATYVLADGFSCRTQIEQGAGRSPLHVAELVHLAQAQARARPGRAGRAPAARSEAGEDSEEPRAR